MLQRILGIDPGSRRTGYGVLDKRGRELRVVASGVFRLPAAEEIHIRLGALQEQLEQLLEEFPPDIVAVEDIFSHRNARSALILGQARGTVLAVAGRRRLPLVAFPPATVKRAVAGHGRAAKEQVQRMVEVLLGLPSTPAEDEADALAVAVCQAMVGQGGRSMEDALAASSSPRRPRPRGLARRR